MELVHNKVQLDLTQYPVAEQRHMLRTLGNMIRVELRRERGPERTIIQECFLEGRSAEDVAARLPGCWMASEVRKRLHQRRKAFLARVGERLKREAPQAYAVFWGTLESESGCEMAA